MAAFKYSKPGVLIGYHLDQAIPISESSFRFCLYPTHPATKQFPPKGIQRRWFQDGLFLYVNWHGAFSIDVKAEVFQFIPSFKGIDLHSCIPLLSWLQTSSFLPFCLFFNHHGDESSGECKVSRNGKERSFILSATAQ